MVDAPTPIPNQKIHSINLQYDKKNYKLTLKYENNNLNITCLEINSIPSNKYEMKYSKKDLEKISRFFIFYDSIEDLVNGLHKRGFKKDPDYMCACHKDKDNSLNYFEPKDNPGEDEWSKEEYENVVFHELVHGIQYSLFGKTPEWLNEGIAKYLDGTYKKGIKYLLDNYINNREIPDQSEIENEFGMHDYDSYDYSYLMVSYLIDRYGKDEFVNIIKQNKINDYKDGLLTESINYYNDKYKEKVK